MNRFERGNTFPQYLSLHRLVQLALTGVWFIALLIPWTRFSISGWGINITERYNIFSLASQARGSGFGGSTLFPMLLGFVIVAAFVAIPYGILGEKLEKCRDFFVAIGSVIGLILSFSLWVEFGAASALSVGPIFATFTTLFLFLTAFARIFTRE
ncbi:MAG: hypothetical protein FWC95_08360 [Defluviitaleaceae bacterium]|nr:hypothetical protein [Defluviitaleaceae bacterium]